VKKKSKKIQKFRKFKKNPDMMAGLGMGEGDLDSLSVKSKISTMDLSEIETGFIGKDPTKAAGDDSDTIDSAELDLLMMGRGGGSDKGRLTKVATKVGNINDIN
jgi:hypothetical protein